MTNPQRRLEAGGAALSVPERHLCAEDATFGAPSAARLTPNIQEQLDEIEARLASELRAAKGKEATP